jgi:hypothetical protein
MTTYGNTILTMADIANEYPKGTLRDMTYSLAARSPLFGRLPMRASNKTTSHVSTFQTSEPTITVLKVGEGISASVGQTDQVEDGMSMLGSLAVTPLKLLELNDDPNEIRSTQINMRTEALRKTAESLLWYGNPADDQAEFLGIMFRDAYNSLGDHVLTAGGTTNQSSIVLMDISPQALFLIYPRNCKGGVYHKDWGEQLVQTDTNVGGAKLPALVDQVELDFGLVIKDPRQLVRLANVDHAEMAGLSGAQMTTDYATNVLFQMGRMQHHIFAPYMGQPAYFMPRVVAQELAFMAQQSTLSNAFSYDQVGGKGPKQLHYNGIPIFISDAMLKTEGVIA